VRIRQYVYFGLVSATFSAAEVTARLLMEPDAVVVRGARRQHPPSPACHAWKVICADPGLTVDEQLSALVARLAPVREPLVALAEEIAGPDGGAVMRVVRDFDAADGEVETTNHWLERLAGRQHQLLGWALDRAVLRFLLDVGADLDVDEYS
jgi:hypothetical protein